MKLDLKKVQEGIVAYRDGCVASEERSFLKAAEFIERFGGRLVDLADVLPEKWRLTFHTWYGVAIENEFEKDKIVPKEEFWFAIKAVEKAFGITTTVQAESEKQVRASGYFMWTRNGNSSQEMTMFVVRITNGDCKVRFEKREMTVAVVDDDCLGKHGKKPAPKAANPA